MNQQYSKEEYFLKKQEIHENLSRYLDEYKELIVKNIVKYANIIKSENCTGEDIAYSKNIKNCYLTNKAENVSYSFNASEVVNCYDCDGF